MSEQANRLIEETSPYLLQHAHNPVDWFPWSNEALEKAKKENKPILVSIGYAACHWCHVMERESFEDETTAAIMNKHFVNIKIDREERPDLDNIYMDAVQAMTGSGGWPLNVFLTPDAKPFYGGTYFPPRRAYNRLSWQEVLQNVVQAFKERRDEIDKQAENLTEHILLSNTFGMKSNDEETNSTSKNSELIVENILKQADKEWGGFGRAPKFPQTAVIQYLLRYYYETGNKESLTQALLTIDKMIEGGIYDQLGGGFARYATDTEWLAPHFEKMLYDNALLISVISEAYQLTRNERYREVIEETIGFIKRELMDDNGAFFAALDADSEGVEGKYYVWDSMEIQKVLKQDALFFSEYYGITEKGNWEHTNILHVRKSVKTFAEEKNISNTEVQEKLAYCRNLLFIERKKRIRPRTDDKIILGWNALFNTALCKAYSCTGNEEYRSLAVRNMNFLLSHFLNEQQGLYHTWKNGIAKFPAFLDDYAFLIQAFIHLQEISGDAEWLLKAEEWTHFVLKKLNDEKSPILYYTVDNQSDVIVRKKEIYDGATPSGNSVMAWNLIQLGILFDKSEWQVRGEDMLRSMGNVIIQYPSSFGNWACLLLEQVGGINEIAIVGENATHLLSEILKKYMPHRVLMGSNKAISTFPLLADKPESENAQIYLCRNYACQRPVFLPTALISLINKHSEVQ